MENNLNATPQTYSFPTEEIELPSKGLLYPADSPLSSGKIVMRYMTAEHEDILTNKSYIEKGVVLDKLMQALIVSKVNYDDLIVGDKNAIMVAARVLGYGKDYDFIYDGEKQTVDLSKIDNKPFDESLVTKGINEFDFTLPSNNTKITFKILNGHDEKKIEQELKGLSKISSNNAPTLSTRLKYIITSVDGDKDPKTIRQFVNNLLARDSKALRDYIRKIQPDVDLTFFPSGYDTPVSIPVGVGFFWPDSE